MEKLSLEEAKENVIKRVKWEPINEQEKNLIQAAIFDLTLKGKEEKKSD